MAKTGVMKPKTTKGEVVSVKITLRDTSPPIWRRVLMASTSTLADLHVAIQASMGWYDSHLHAFELDGEQYSTKGSLEDCLDERRVKLAALVKAGVKKIPYTYDFGDSWDHLVALEKTLQPEAGQKYPVCTAGKRACPPEDCGGPPGYEEFLEILANPDHEEHEERLDWAGGEFDPEQFTPAEANERLANWVS